MTGNEVIRALEALPDSQRDHPIIFIDDHDPNTSWGIDEVSVLSTGFVAFKSVDV